MKKILFFALSLISLSTFAQQSDTLYSYTNVLGKDIKVSKTSNIYQIYKLSDSSWVRTTSNQNLVLLKRETFSDEKLTILNGNYIEYENGKAKMKGFYRNGKRDGVWNIYNKDGQIEESKTYPDN
ncbi:hypothetical protein [Pedobacter aquatilis]|uniref:hypothetical protein n=1 Tax=Pedobacter aquatilis TaxID=351343 RepID=UPI00293066C3|nr:hypothetical protein [Pedobacter aquatilis]